jgi:hypothetical protein
MLTPISAMALGEPDRPAFTRHCEPQLTDDDIDVFGTVEDRDNTQRLGVPPGSPPGFPNAPFGCPETEESDASYQAVRG